MPYIPLFRHEEIRNGSPACTPGELNFQIIDCINRYLLGKPRKYKDYNEVIGVLECAKLELYRKVISKYEDKKCEENGEVF